MSWTEDELQNISIGDKRLDQRAKQLLMSIASKPTISIPAACNGWSETKAAYRLLDNGAVTAEKILEPHKNATLERLKDKETVLCIEDTTELDYSKKTDIDGLGPLNLEIRQGLYLHPMLAVTPDRVCHGVLNWNTVIREPGSLGKKKEPRKIEEKESYRWLEGYRVACNLSNTLPRTSCVYVADREADIYEIYAEKHLRDNSTEEASAEFLVRSKHDRVLANGEKLWSAMKKAPVLGEVAFDIADAPSHIKRSVIQTIQVMTVTLKGQKRFGEQLPDVQITAILAREDNPPKGELAVEWLLFTSKQINTLEEALTVIEWYLCRWQIEIYFKVLKSGCKVEELQLERVTRLEPMLALYMIVAWRVVYMTMLGRECPEFPCDVLFDEQEWKAAYIVHNKKKPPKQPPPLDEMIRIVAGLGGFLNRKNDGFPGPKTIWIGLQRCRDFVLAIEAHNAIHT
jgi:hypothetical protein